MSEKKKLKEDEAYFEKPIPSEEVKKNQHIIHEHYDKQYTISILEKLGNICHDTYFRSKFIGFEDSPERIREDTPYILIGNHSGMAFPWDAIIFAGFYNYKFLFEKDSLRPLVAPSLSETALMNPFLIRNFWKKTGGIDATYLNFETLMQQEEFNVMIFPEGVPGIGKGFNKRYQLQKFHTSYLRMALKYKTDLHWMSTINGEYINPYSYSFDWINKLSKQIGIPFLPINLMLIAIVLQPWFFYFSFPSKLIFVRGPRIQPYRMIDKPYEQITEEELNELNSKINDIAQAHINESVKKYGKPHYNWKELLSKIWENRRYFPFYLPPFWPLIYSDFDKKYRKLGHTDFDVEFSFKGFLKMIIRNPIFFAYFIPLLGWIPILLKGYHKHRINANEKRRRANLIRRQQKRHSNTC